MLQISRTLKVLIFIFAVIVAGLFFRTDYYLIQPGSAEDLSRLVAVEGADRGDRGRFYLVTVSQLQANLPQVVYGYLHPHIELQRRESIVPPDMDFDEYRDMLRQWMQESQDTAKIIALRRAGYDVEIRSQGVVIRGLLENSPASGILQEGDIIVAVDGEPVALTNEVIARVQDRRIGDPVQLVIRRDNETLELAAPTYPLQSDPTLPALGIYISSLGWEPVIPVEIQIETGEISGPSAGMMFVLEIMNQLLPQDLTRGHRIAGTGTIDINEKVGRIGGVRQKVVAAEKRGASYFLVPSANLSEAVETARKIQLVPVDTLQEALEFLESLSPQAAQNPENLYHAVQATKDMGLPAWAS